MTHKSIVRVLFCVFMALLTFGFVWGVYIVTLLIGLHSSGEASHAAGVVVAVLLHCICYRVARIKLTRRQRWLSCSLGVIPIMAVFMAAFNAEGNFALLGEGFNTALFIEMLIFAAVTAVYELVKKYLIGHRPDEEENEDVSDDRDKPEKKSGEEAQA